MALRPRKASLEEAHNRIAPIRRGGSCEGCPPERSGTGEQCHPGNRPGAAAGQMPFLCPIIPVNGKDRGRLERRHQQGQTMRFPE